MLWIAQFPVLMTMVCAKDGFFLRCFKDSLSLFPEDPLLHKSRFPTPQRSQTLEKSPQEHSVLTAPQNISCGFLLCFCVFVKNQGRKKKFDSFESFSFPPTCHYRRIPARNSHSADIKPKANYMIIPERVLQGGQRDAVVSDHIHFIMCYCTTSAFILLNISSTVKNVHLLYVPYSLPQRPVQNVPGSACIRMRTSQTTTAWSQLLAMTLHNNILYLFFGQ